MAIYTQAQKDAVRKDLEDTRKLFRMQANAPQMYEALEAWEELWEMRPLDSGADIQELLARCWAKTSKVLAAIDGENTWQDTHSKLPCAKSTGR